MFEENYDVIIEESEDLRNMPKKRRNMVIWRGFSIGTCTIINTSCHLVSLFSRFNIDFGDSSGLFHA